MTAAQRDSTCRARCVWLGSLASWRQGLVKRLVKEIGSPAEILDQPVDDLAAMILSWPRRRRARAAAKRRSFPDGGDEVASSAEEQRFAALLAAGPDECQRQMEGRPGGDMVVAWCDSLYPPNVRHLSDPPLCLFVHAACAAEETARRLSTLAAHPAVAVVGTRSPSPYGEEMARMLGRDLTYAGLLVVSGLAMGVDAAAQAAAAKASAQVRRQPSTVAVLGCGADVVYPRCNVRLYSDVARGGLVLSEFAWGVPARPWRFPARNRVMAALSRGVVIVEGTQRSGARITAGHALDLGREVLCVPGEAGRRLSEAPHALLRDGGRICEGAEDVLRGIAVESVGSPPPAEGNALGSGGSRAAAYAVLENGEGAFRDVLRALERATLSIDELAARCSLPASQVAATVSELEVEGLVRRVDGGRYRLRRR